MEARDHICWGYVHNMYRQAAWARTALTVSVILTFSLSLGCLLTDSATGAFLFLTVTAVLLVFLLFLAMISAFMDGYCSHVSYSMDRLEITILQTFPVVPFLPCRLKNIRCRKYSIASIKQISTDAGKHQITLTGQEMHFSIYAAPKEYATVLELLRSRIPVSDSTLSQQWNKSI